ncbi:hypothetical protein [Thermococcus gorgonarius]|uniref:hypothetical protein n=1 Tax=Thermococcus gorgonarius TaxID=71997 RepID=UPI0012FD7AEF|nr:hypothetical protein [Thermococcus gorgonarius]
MIYGGVRMLARIVYYRRDSLPEEVVVVTNDLEKAKRLARDRAKEFNAFDYEVEWVA